MESSAFPLTSKYPVAIVGAGPADLTAALALAYYEILFMIFEANPGLSTEAKAGTTLIRTLEIWQRFGAANKILSKAMRVDVSDNAAVEKMLAVARTKYPRLDAAVLGAAIQIRSEIGVMTAAQWRKVIDVNLNGVFYCLNAIVPMMKAQKSGAIVAFTSGLASTGWPGASAYAASKAALVGMIKSVAHELKNYNVRANILSPGLRDGDFHGREHGHRTRILSELAWDWRAGGSGADATVSNFGRFGEPDGRGDRATHHPGARTYGTLKDGMGFAYWQQGRSKGRLTCTN